MLSRMRIALKFMTYGIVVGLLFAPRRGAEMRHELIRWARARALSLRGGRRGAAGASR
ncbi:MAG: YtxH domain-containing protein [Sphaerobacter sp.]|nr:YtxH domain-containing protein [Sphaerobacter sp.]